MRVDLQHCGIEVDRRLESIGERKTEGKIGIVKWRQNKGSQASRYDVVDG